MYTWSESTSLVFSRCGSIIYVSSQAIQPLDMARGLKFRIYEIEVLYLRSSENKGADQLRGMICVFVFAYAKRWFSYDAAQISLDYH